MKDAVEHMLQAAVIVAPTSKEQEALGRMVNDMRAAGESEKEIFVELANAVLDGIHYGRWPQ